MQRMIGCRLFLVECPMSDSLNQSERYRALAEEYLRLAATSSSTEIRDRYLRMARITAGWLSPKNQADRPTTISRQAMATENANNARPARTSTVTGRSPKPWRIVETPNGFAVDDATGRQLGVFYGRTDPNTAGDTDFLMIDETRQIAVDFARLPELLKQTSDQSNVTTSPEDDKLTKLQTSRSPQRAPETSRLPRAAQLPPVTGLLEAATTVPHSVWSEPDECWSEPDELRSTPLLRRASEPPPNWTKYLIDVAVAPQATTDVPSVEFLPFRKADAPSANATDVTVESRAEPEVKTESLLRKADAPSANATDVTVESRAEPEVRTASLQPAVRLDIKPSESEVEARPQQTSSERGSQFFAANGHDPTCFPSASAVRQNRPGGWPSWTLRAPGHEGTRCWYAASRTTAHDHRSAMMPRKETVGVMEKLGSPGGLFDVLFGVTP